MDLSLNLKAVVSQRLVPKANGKGRRAAIEILLNTPMVSDQIFKGEVHGLKETMAKSKEAGMQTFDQALFDLYEAGEISYEDAMRNADSIGEFKLAVKLNSKRKVSDDARPKVELSVNHGPDAEKAEDKPVTGPASFAPSPDPVAPRANTPPPAASAA
jgi:twitching motility protein PilU